MATIIIRTIIIYSILIGAMRLMGKRQIGQLEVSDLVSTLLLSELAALPIENHDIPLLYAVIPTVLLMSIEIFTAALQGRFPKLKNLFSPRPSILIRMGQPDFAELKKCRMSSDELLIALRKSGTTDISELHSGNPEPPTYPRSHTLFSNRTAVSRCFQEHMQNPQQPKTFLPETQRAECSV